MPAKSWGGGVWGSYFFPGDVPWPISTPLRISGTGTTHKTITKSGGRWGGKLRPQNGQFSFLFQGTQRMWQEHLKPVKATGGCPIEWPRAKAGRCCQELWGGSQPHPLLL